MQTLESQRHLVWLIALATLFLSSGCVSTSALQTGRTLDKGNTRMHFVGGVYYSPSFDEAVEDAIEEDEVTLSAPYLEFALRHGVTENFELGGKVTLPGGLTLDGKYQLHDADDIAVSAGLGLGYFSFKEPSSNEESDPECVSDCDGENPVYETYVDTNEPFTIIDVIVPIYASYHVSEEFALYTSPKYILRSVNDDYSNHLGITMGTRLGNDWGFFLEGTYMSALSEDFVTVQYAGSLFIDF